MAAEGKNKPRISKKAVVIFISAGIVLGLCFLSGQGGFVLLNASLENARGNYCDSMDLFGMQLKNSPSSVFHTLVQNAYDEALSRCAEDTGARGMEIMARQYESLCKSIWPEPKIHPSVGVLEESPKVWIRPEYIDPNLFADYPSDIWADRPGTFQLALCIKEDYRQVEICPYRGGGTVRRISIVWTASLKSTQSADIIAEHAFEGLPPEKCHFIQKFPRGETLITLSGTDPDIAEILEWVRQQMVSSAGAD